MDFNNIKKVSDLNRERLEAFIKTLPKEDKENLRNFTKEHPQTNAAGIFSSVRAYIFNTYFREAPVISKKTTSFAETLDILLNTEEEENI